MGDVLPALSVPALVLAGGAYAVGASWWRRRHPSPPSPYTRQALRLAEERTLVTAEEILADAHAAFGPLYTSSCADADTRDADPAARATAHSSDAAPHT
ncbi:hypothetical protein [Streptomyces sp. NPDC002690]